MPVLGHQIPLFAALAGQKLPRDLDEHAKILHFGVSANRVQQVIVVDVSLARIALTEDADAGRFAGHVSVLALIRDEAGNILEQLSQDYPLSGALSRIQEARRSHITFARHFALPPGEYVVEAGVRDDVSGRIGASRDTVSVTPPPQGVAVSSVAVVDSLAASAGAANDTSNPLLFESLLVTPAVSAVVRREPGKEELALYNVVYPQAGLAEAPSLTVDLVRAGKVVVSGKPALPSADAEGRIKHLVTLPLAPLTPGDYEVQFTVRQGGSVAVARAHVTVESPTAGDTVHQ